MKEASLSSHVVSLASQQEMVQGITTPNRYSNFISGQFRLTTEWLLNVHMYPKPKDEEISQEFHRFLGMVGIVCARFGFPGMIFGLESRGKAITEISAGNPHFQLALASHVGRMDKVVLAKKEEMFDAISRIDESAAYGAYGLFLKTSRGEIAYKKTLAKAIERFEDRKKYPIFMPDPEMSTNLGKLNFTLQDAVDMDNKTFRRKVLPKVERIFDGWVDTHKVFVRKYTRSLAPFYSI